MGYPVLVVDEHEMVGTALSMALRVRGLDAQRVAAATVGERRPRPPVGCTGLAVLDLDSERATERPRRAAGAGLVGCLRRLGWKVLVVSGGPSERAEPEVAAAIASGAIASLPKSTTSFDMLLSTIATAAEDRAVMTSAQRRHWVARDTGLRQWERELARLLGRLSHREREVLDMLAAGHRAADIAEHRMVSINTVRTHIRAVLTKLEVNSQQEAVALLRPPRELGSGGERRDEGR